jgi:hypothetical protein
MKALFLVLSMLAANSAFAANVPATGSWDVRCLIFTTGPSRDDVKFLASGKYTLELGEKVPMTVMYKEGNLEFRAWLTHFSPEDRPELTSNMVDVGIFENGKYIAGSRAEFDDEISKAIQFMMPNMTATKGPPTISISCRREK